MRKICDRATRHIDRERYVATDEGIRLFFRDLDLYRSNA